METKSKNKEEGLLFVGGFWSLFANFLAVQCVLEYFFGHSTSEIFIVALLGGTFLGSLLTSSFGKVVLKDEN
jgi:hypothetical protein